MTKDEHIAKLRAALKPFVEVVNAESRMRENDMGAHINSFQTININGVGTGGGVSLIAEHFYKAAEALALTSSSEPPQPGAALGGEAMSDILSCPFCGQPPETFASGENGRGLMIECLTDGCVNPHTSYYDHDAAKRVWNRRFEKAAEIDLLNRALQLEKEQRAFIQSQYDKLSEWQTRHATECAMARK